MIEVLKPNRPPRVSFCKKPSFLGVPNLLRLEIPHHICGMRFPPSHPVIRMRRSPKLLFSRVTLGVLRIFQLPRLDGLALPPGPPGFFIAGLLLTVGLRVRLIQFAAAMAQFPSHGYSPPGKDKTQTIFLRERLIYTIHRIHRKEKK